MSVKLSMFAEFFTACNIQRVQWEKRQPLPERANGDCLISFFYTFPLWQGNSDDVSVPHAKLSHNSYFSLLLTLSLPVMLIAVPPDGAALTIHMCSHESKWDRGTESPFPSPRAQDLPAQRDVETNAPFVLAAESPHLRQMGSANSHLASISSWRRAGPGLCVWRVEQLSYRSGRKTTGTRTCRFQHLEIAQIALLQKFAEKKHVANISTHQPGLQW